MQGKRIPSRKILSLQCSLRYYSWMSLRSEGNMALFLLCVHKHLAILDSLGLGNQDRMVHR